MNMGESKGNTVLAISCGEQWDKVTDFPGLHARSLTLSYKRLILFLWKQKNFYSFFFFFFGAGKSHIKHTVITTFNYIVQWH